MVLSKIQGSDEGLMTSRVQNCRPIKNKIKIKIAVRINQWTIINDHITVTYRWSFANFVNGFGFQWMMQYCIDAPKFTKIIEPAVIDWINYLCSIFLLAGSQTGLLT